MSLKLEKRPAFYPTRDPLDWLEDRLKSVRELAGNELEQRHRELLCDFRAKHGPPVPPPPPPLPRPPSKADSSDAHGTWAYDADVAERGSTEETVAPLPRLGLSSSVLDSTAKAAKEELVPTRQQEMLADGRIRRSSSLLQQKGMEVNTKLQLFFDCATICMLVVLALTVQYEGLDLGYKLNYQRYDRAAEEAWPIASVIFDVFFWAFGLLFTLEAILKLRGMGLSFFKDLWNVFDFCITLLWYVEAWEKIHVGRLQFPFEVSWVRVMRLVRCLRLVRLAETVKKLDKLYLMTTALRSSLGTLAWALVILLFSQILVAILLNQTLHFIYFENEDYSLSDRRKVFEFFGSFSRALLSTFEMTLANWPPVCRLLTEKISEWFILFCVCHKMFFGFAVIGVINAVFIQETFKVVGTDDLIMVREKERVTKAIRNKLRLLFDHADENGDGRVDNEEWEKVLSDPNIKFWMASMDIDVRDPAALLSLIDSEGLGISTLDQFMKAMEEHRGTARSMDVARLAREVRDIGKYLPRHEDYPQGESFESGLPRNPRSFRESPQQLILKTATI